MTGPRGEASPSWNVIPADRIEEWNALLLQTTASFYQFPFWNEPFRQLRFQPIYLSYGTATSPRAYACILSFGIPGFRIGLLPRGPVTLNSSDQLDIDVFGSLAKWARRKGYIFLRFDAADPAVLGVVARTGTVLERDMFPLLKVPSRSLLVQLHEDESKLLASFKPNARYEIRMAERFGYEVHISDSSDELRRAWRLMEMTASRKGFQIYRPLSHWLRTFDLGRRHNCVRICAIYLRGRPIQAILLVNDSTIADYVYGGLDVDALGDNPSPGCLLHWRGMREAWRLGCKLYDLGGDRDEKVQIFKRKFRPTECVWPAPFTLVTNRALFPLWEKAIMGGVKLLWPRVKAVTARLLR